MRYKLVAEDIATGAVADTYKTIASLIVADTAGHRCRIRSIAISFADGTPNDRGVAFDLKRIADVSAGAAGTKTAVAAGNIAKVDPGSIDSLISGGRAYTVEPTAYATEALWEFELNDRNSAIKEWDEDHAPVFIADQLAGVRAAPRTANAAQVSTTIEYEVF